MVVVVINESDYKDLRKILERENLKDIATIMPILIDLYNYHNTIIVCPKCGHDERDNDLTDTPDLFTIS